jgi:hypothetical protein
MSWRTEQNGFIKTWAQDVRNSYKVRLKYVLVPKGVKTDVRFIDTPYRFQTYQEAREYAKELFPCYSYAVEGSPDQPNFNETQFVQRTTKEELQNIKYYDVYGVKRSYMKEPLDSREMNEPIITKRNKKKIIPSKKLTVEEQIEQKLTDIEVLRKKLDQKESDLTKMKNSIASNNSKRNNVTSREQEPILPSYNAPNNSKRNNVTSREQEPILPSYNAPNNSKRNTREQEAILPSYTASNNSKRNTREQEAILPSYNAPNNSKRNTREQEAILPSYTASNNSKRNNVTSREQEPILPSYTAPNNSKRNTREQEAILPSYTANNNSKTSKKNNAKF